MNEVNFLSLSVLLLEDDKSVLALGKFPSKNPGSMNVPH